MPKSLTCPALRLSASDSYPIHSCCRYADKVSKVSIVILAFSSSISILRSISISPAHTIGNSIFLRRLTCNKFAREKKRKSKRHTRTPTPRSGQYLTHAHSHITRAVMYDVRGLGECWGVGARRRLTLQRLGMNPGTPDFMSIMISKNLTFVCFLYVADLCFIEKCYKQRVKRIKNQPWR